MRLFVAISIPDEISTKLERVIQHLRPTAQLNWSKVYNLHITTRFIGEWPKERLEEVRSALQTVHAEPFDVELAGLGWFPNPHRPRVLFAPIKRNDALHQLASRTNEALASIGLKPEDKAYTPHITLARVKGEVPLIRLKQAIATMETLEFGGFRVDHFELFLSETGSAGSVYTSLAEFPLTAL